MSPAPGYWRDRRVLITGHTGFKGAWLAAWLHRLGARVTGYALAPPTDPSLFALARLDRTISSHIGDIRDGRAFGRVLADSQSEVVFHLAAQPLVRAAYADPMETFSTNVLGLCQVLETVRRQDSVTSVVVVTSDKCYENREWTWPYRETDPLGGHDPYSASKACQELTAAAWYRSFLRGRGVRLATARAGNVIGGGDFAADRLLPDLVRGALAHRPVPIRNPSALRPWQHVLDPLAGYLRLAEHLVGYRSGGPADHPCEGAAQPAADTPEAQPMAWNFGPDAGDSRSVRAVAGRFAELWGEGACWVPQPDADRPEARTLRLDSSRARERLQWVPRWGVEEALARTVAWYRAWHAGADCGATLARELADYEGD